VFLRDRVDVLKMRLLAVKSKQCASKKNKYHCPEIFLDAVADKLTTTADLFLDAELLSKFFYIVRTKHSKSLSFNPNSYVVSQRTRCSPRALTFTC
jgi:replication fork clamp-binding protein CrfC